MSKVDFSQNEEIPGPYYSFVMMTPLLLAAALKLKHEFGVSFAECFLQDNGIAPEVIAELLISSTQSTIAAAMSPTLEVVPISDKNSGVCRT
jgi:hypothetical protein